jgi:ATP synthase protein I
MKGLALYGAVQRVLQLQVLAMLLVFLVSLGLGGKQSALSALVGGMIGLIPNLCFAWLFGRKNPAKTAKQVVSAFYFGETIKLIITAILFAIAFQWSGLLPLPLFAAFGLVMAAFWFALLLGN